MRIVIMQIRGYFNLLFRIKLLVVKATQRSTETFCSLQVEHSNETVLIPGYIFFLVGFLVWFLGTGNHLLRSTNYFLVVIAVRK